MRKWCDYMFWKFYVILIICYYTLQQYWWVLRLLSISLRFSDLCAYAFVILIWIILLGYIIMPSFIVIPVYATNMLLWWTLLIKNTHVEIYWMIPSLMNSASSYSPIVRKRTLEILWPRVIFQCILSYFDVGGIQRVFMLYLVIVSLPYLMKWDLERLFLTGSLSYQIMFMGRPWNPWRYKNRTWFGDFYGDLLFVHRTQLTHKTKFKRILAATVLRFHEAFIGIIGNELSGKYKDPNHHPFLHKIISLYA